MLVTTHRCGECGEHFDEPGGPIYCCSRCGGEQVEERRCSECNIFMAKIADESCPSCEQGGEFIAVEVWQSEDGEFFESAEEEQRWIADAPVRETQRADNERRTAELMERLHQERVARCQALEPRLALFVSLSVAAPKLQKTAAMSLAEIQCDPGSGSIYMPYIYLAELAALLIPDYPNLEALTERATDYVNIDVHERRTIEREVREAVMTKLSRNDATADLMSRIDRGDDFGFGTGLGCEMEQLLDLVLEPLAERALL